MNNMIANFKSVVMDQYTQFRGRASRAVFWQYILVYAVISIAFSLLIDLLSDVRAVYYILVVLYCLIALALLAPTLAINVRRLHDIGKGGGWIFVNLIPIIGGLWYLILMIKEGEPQSNRFGDRPE
ncbi:hypothetical protein BHU16_10325 [Tannerella sp. oral taxon 808]|nr:hypothetical protein BHU16_10325 [Tannerella sp. oral taxon 808]